MISPTPLGQSLSPKSGARWCAGGDCVSIQNKCSPLPQFGSNASWALPSQNVCLEIGEVSLMRTGPWKVAISQASLSAPLSDGPTFQKCWSFGHQSSPLTPRALPLGRHTERTPTHTAVPPNPAVEPLPVSLLNSFFCYFLGDDHTRAKQEEAGQIFARTN